MRSLPTFNILFLRWYTNRKCKKIDFLKSDLSYNPLRFHIALKITYIINKKNLRIFLHDFGMFYIKTYQIPMLLSE